MASHAVISDQASSSPSRWDEIERHLEQYIAIEATHRRALYALIQKMRLALRIPTDEWADALSASSFWVPKEGGDPLFWEISPIYRLLDDYVSREAASSGHANYLRANLRRALRNAEERCAASE